MFLWNPRSNPRKKFQANKNIIDEAIYFCESLELIRRRNVSKQDLTNAKYFCEILDRIRRRNVDQTKSHWCHIFLSNPRTNNLWKKFRANKNLMIWCHIFMWNPGTNRQKKCEQTRSHRSHVFLWNPRTNPQNKCRGNKISVMPYISVKSPN
jgi:hypothetical protein